MTVTLEAPHRAEPTNVLAPSRRRALDLVENEGVLHVVRYLTQ